MADVETETAARSALEAAVTALGDIKYSTDEDICIRRVLDAFEAVERIAANPEFAGYLACPEHIVASALWYSLNAQLDLDLEEVSPYADAGTSFVAFARTMMFLEAMDRVHFLQEDSNPGASLRTIQSVRTFLANVKPETNEPPCVD